MSSNPTTTAHLTVDELASKAELGVVVEVGPALSAARPRRSGSRCALGVSGSASPKLGSRRRWPSESYGRSSCPPRRPLRTESVQPASES
jgi:hypothetical protein